MIAKINETEGVCMGGRWYGWLFRRGPEGQWVSVRKLDVVDPMEGNQLSTLFAAREGEKP